MDEETVREIVKWGRVVEDAGKANALNPAMMDYFCEYVANGDTPADAAARASEACEIVKPISEL